MFLLEGLRPGWGLTTESLPVEELLHNKEKLCRCSYHTGTDCTSPTRTCTPQSAGSNPAPCSNTGFVYLATISCIRTYYVNTYLSLYFTDSSVICVLQADNGNDDRCNGKTYLSGYHVDTHLINIYEG